MKFSRESYIMGMVILSCLLILNSGLVSAAPDNSTKTLEKNGTISANSHQISSVASVSKTVAARASTNNFTPQDIGNAAISTKNYIDSNNKLPGKVKIGTTHINMAQLLHLMTTATLRINAKNNSAIPLTSDVLPSNSKDEFTTGTLFKSEYLDFAKRIRAYMDINHQAPPYGLVGLGKVSYPTLIYTYSQILNSYNSNKLLPASISVKSWYQITNSIKIQTVTSRTGGTVLNNKYINTYISKTALSNKVIEAAKHGTPLITIGNGNGPKVMIVAGVHGNELPAPIAAMKLINYLSTNSIKGTVYIIPFAIPSNTASTTRNWHGKNPNRIANIPGTPTYQIIQLAKHLNVDALGDFHSTMPGGDPGRDSALGSKSPTYESYSMASYISKATGSSLITYQKSGVEYPSALEDVSNLSGIPSVTCEVAIPHGTASASKIEKSFNQMLAFLKYKKIL